MSPVAPAGADAAASHLQLEVWINGQPTDLIGAFDLAPDGDISATAAELRSLGLQARGGPASRIRLLDLPGVKARYETATQRLHVQAVDAALIPHRIEAHKAHASRRAAQTETGAILNYSLGGQIDEAEHSHRWSTTEVAGNFEARVFGPFGVITSTAESEIGASRGDFRRLDTTWSAFDPDSLIAVRAGDVISGGFDWTRPVRLGGLQIRRAFSLRPDLVTMPTPSLSGSAAVPSVAEVMINGATVVARSVASGPLAVDNLPAVQGASFNTLVLRDSLGRRTTVSVPFFATPEMLSAGLLDFSAETGLARRFYGIRSFDYDGHPVGSGSLRYGLNDWATGEMHIEGGAGLILAGIGGVARLGGLGALTGSLSASNWRGATGEQASLGLQGQLGPVSFGAREQASFGRFADLGAATAPVVSWKVQTDNLPPRRVIQFNSAVALPPIRAWRGFGPISAPSLSLSYSSLTPWGAARRDIWSMSLRQSLPNGASLYATAYKSGHGAGEGFFVGLSIALGGRRSANLGAEGSGAGASAFVEASEQAEQRPGGFGWRVRAESGRVDDLEAEANYISPIGRADVLLQRLNGSNAIEGRLDGALVFMDRRVMLSDRINDAFAVVETGRAHIPVMFENRQAGTTGPDGRLILPYLTAYNDNAVAIDPGALPADLTVDHNRRIAMPVSGAGAVVRFDLHAASPGHLIVLRDASDVLPVGSLGWIEPEQGRPFVIGYDGQAYVENARAGQVMHVRLAAGKVCTARLDGGGKDLHATPCL